MAGGADPVKEKGCNLFKVAALFHFLVPKRRLELLRGYPH